MNPEDRFQKFLQDRKDNSLLRHDTSPAPDTLDMASNDYLHFSRHPAIMESMQSAIDACGTGATASRLIRGTSPLHHELENQLARFKGYPAALVFGSGFLANTGIIPALVGRDDHIYADKLIHASLIDGARLSGAELHRYPHNNLERLAEMLAQHPTGRQALVITESVFSMDGDLAPLEQICEMASHTGTLIYVDEAHATGIFGEHGQGRVHELQLQDRVHVTMGTFSKALGGYGAYACCSAIMRDYLVNNARSFIYSTALPPHLMAGMSTAINELESLPRAGSAVLTRAERLRERFRSAGIDTLQSASAIIPLVVGDDAKAVQLGETLRSDGIHLGTIRPPTVPVGTARLRMTVSLKYKAEIFDAVADQIIQRFRDARVI